MWQQNETCYILEGVRRNCNMFHLFALSADDNYSITVTLYGWCPPSKMVSNGSKGTKFNDMSIQILAFTVQKYVNSHPTPGPHCANSKLLLKQGSRSARLSPQSMIHYACKLFIKQPYNTLCKVFHNIGNDRMTR